MEYIRFIILIVVLFLLNCSKDNPVTPAEVSFTDIQGKLTTDLKYAASPYRVLKSIHIEANDTISIEQGVKLFFADSCMFVINGKLIARGNKYFPVLFTSLNEKWQGIKILDSDHDSNFQYVVFQNAVTNDNNLSDYGALEINKSIVNISNCIFKNNSSMQN